MKNGGMKMENRMRSGALYIRVSTDKQEELSPDAQKRLLLDYAESHEITIASDMIFTENGISGRKAEKRPEFQRMIGYAKSENPPFSMILVWKFSRFARNQEESIVYKSMLKKQHGIDVVSITEPLIEGPFGSLIERIIEWMDEYYSINLSDEVLRGMTEKAMRGGYQTTPALGYASPGKNQPFIVVPAEAEIVKSIFHQYVDLHRDVTAIARSLNESHYVTKRGNPFDGRGVQRILQNQFYVGRVIWRGIERNGVHETFIRPEVFRAANDRLTASSRAKNRRTVSACAHWLSGLVKCSVCYASLGYNRGKYPYFHCWKQAKGIHTGSSGISEPKLTQGVLQFFEQMLDCTELSFEFQEASACHIESDDEKKRLERELERLQMKRQRIKEAYEDGIDTLEEYRERKRQIDEKIDQVTSLLFHLSQTKAEPCSESEASEVIKDVYDLIRSTQIGYEKKGIFMRAVAEKIIWDPKSETLSFFLDSQRYL